MEKAPRTIKAKTVDEYLHELPEAQRDMLEKLREAIKTAAPKAEEVISYRIPTYKYHGPWCILPHSKIISVNQ